MGLDGGGFYTRSPGEEGGKGCRTNLMMDLTALYPIAAEQATVEAFGGRFTCLAIVRFRFNTKSQSLLNGMSLSIAHGYTFIKDS